ncbi:MAG: DUF393 domain-containing protein [Synechococcales cyanobacterium CRU_2_2]|nr:DUF393 domain-containing protein [Synechococcales cyanobacterium CRU_2_2]
METPLSLSSEPPAQEPEPQLLGNQPIVFFDGECVMCNGFVDLLLAIDTPAKLRVAPLQGTTAQALLPPLPHDSEQWSIYYLDERGLFYQSEAVVQILRRLGGLWSVLSLGGTIPRPARDAVYRFVARNRYRLLGKRGTCRMPTAAEQARFLP